MWEVLLKFDDVCSPMWDEMFDRLRIQSHSTCKQLYYHLGQLLQFRESNRPGLMLGFLALKVLLSLTGTSLLIRVCTVEPRDFQFMSTSGLITGRWTLSMAWHATITSVDSLLFFLLLALLFCSLLPQWEIMIWLFWSFLLTLRMKSKLLIQVYQALGDLKPHLLHAPLPTIGIRHICLLSIPKRSKLICCLRVCSAWKAFPSGLYLAGSILSFVSHLKCHLLSVAFLTRSV